ncbi:hypothetical protein H072_6750, partial [Dactylellina haptotyla CBS 200.50]
LIQLKGMENQRGSNSSMLLSWDFEIYHFQPTKDSKGAPAPTNNMLRYNYYFANIPFILNLVFVVSTY